MSSRWLSLSIVWLVRMVLLIVAACSSASPGADPEQSRGTLRVTPNKVTLVVGATARLAAELVAADGGVTAIDETAWSTVGTAASVAPQDDGSVVVTAVHAGTTTLLMQAAMGAAAAAVLVTDAVVAPSELISIELAPVAPTLPVGVTRELVATGVFSDGHTEDLTTEAVWTSSSPAFASVSDAVGSKGEVTTHALGKTTIAAAARGVRGSTPLVVSAGNLVSIAVTPSDPTIAAGTTRRLTAIGTYSDATKRDLSAIVRWSSSDVAVVTVDEVGRASGVGPGAAFVQATLEHVSGITTVTVSNATVVSIAVTPANRSIAAGTTQQLVATGTFSDATTQDLTADATWGSSAEAVATVSVGGLATGVAAGSTTIGATFGAISASTPLTVF